MNQDGSALVSVVTPVYNGEAHLRECIESVLAQTYPHFEYLVVDNCSTDGTRELVREYESRDSRIRLVTPEGFLSADENANRALRLVSRDAKYVKVVHADDRLLERCLEEMVAHADRNPQVGIVSAYRLIGDAVDPPEGSLGTTVLRGRDVGRSALLGGPLPYVFGSPSTLLLRADLVRARRTFYTEDNPHQSDQEACLDLLRECDLGFVGEVLTFTRRHDASESPGLLRLGAPYPCRVRHLQGVGHDYLESHEYQRKLAVYIVEYAWFLLRRVRSLADPEFRAFHREELRKIGRRLHVRTVGVGAARQVVRSALRRLRRRTSQEAPS